MEMPEKEFNARKSESRGSTSVVMAAPPKRREGTIGALKREKKT